MEQIDITKERKVKFSDALMPGLIIAAYFIIYSFLNDTFIVDLTVKKYVGYLSWIIVIPIFYYFTKNFTKNSMENYLSYGESFLFLFYTSIIFSIIVGIYTYVNITFINPDFVDNALAMAENELYKQDKLTQDQIDQALLYQRKFMQPGILTTFSILVSVFFGVIASLILSIFFKKEQPITAE